MPDTELSPKALAKRKTILGIALQVFAKEGFRNADVQVIANLAKVGKGTVYRHFGNKEQLFLATAKHCLDRMGEYVNKRVDETDETAAILKSIAVAYAEFYQKHPQCVEIMIQERAEFRDSVFPTHLMYRSETRGAFDDFLRQAMDNGDLREVDVTEATNAFADLLYGSVINGCLEGKKANLVKRLEHAVEIFLNGLLVTD